VLRFILWISKSPASFFCERDVLRMTPSVIMNFSQQVLDVVVPLPL
jgi:hypothetical protein